MKKLISLALASLLVVVLAACGGAASSTPASTPASTGGDASTAGSAAGGGEGISIVHVVAGNLGDLGLSDMVQAALERYVAEYGGSVNAIELNYDASLNESTMMDVCKSGEYDLVASGFYNLKEALVAAATEYPDQKFIAFDIEVEGLPNVKSIQALQNEGSFLAGALAALMTTRTDVEGINEDKVIGFVGGMENTAILDFLTGYVEGAKFIDPEVQVKFSFIGDFSDTAKAKELTLALYQQGADIVYAVCSTASNGVADAAAEAGRYCLGVDWDLAESLKTNKPDTAKWVMSSCLKDLETLVYGLMMDYQAGSIEWGTHTFAGVAEGGMRMADNEYFQAIVPQDVQTELADVTAKVAAGEIEVGTAIGADQATIDAMKALAESTSAA